MVRPNPNNKNPYSNAHPKMYDADGREQPAMPPQAVQRPTRPETPAPTFSSLLKFVTIRRSRMHKISGGLLHVHKNGLRTREPTCPANATCVGIDDIGEFMYNQARKCRHLLDEVNRNRNPDLPPITDKTPANEFIAEGPVDGNLHVVVEIGPPYDGMEQQNCWDSSATSKQP